MEARALGPPKKSHQLVDRLLQHICSGEWAKGMRLPSERVLAASHRVSRTAVREALSALQLAGYIETRVGDGSYVASADASDRQVLAGVGIVEKLEAREALEIACVSLAIRNASRSETAKLDAGVRQLRKLVASGDFKRYLAATLDFHLDVARAAHNPYLLGATRDLIERHRADQWLLHERYSPKTALHSLRMHVAIADAIRDKDLTAAIAAVSNHYEHYPVLSAPRS